MKKFGLFTKSNDLVNKVEAESESQALTFFAKVKDLKKDLLLGIFQVREIKQKV